VLSSPSERAAYAAALAAAAPPPPSQQQQQASASRPPPPGQGGPGARVLYCGSCGGEHVCAEVTGIPLVEAGVCDVCGVRHVRSPGCLFSIDGWYRRRVFVASCEGRVFDVTAWAACDGVLEAVRPRECRARFRIDPSLFGPAPPPGSAPRTGPMPRKKRGKGR